MWSLSQLYSVQRPVVIAISCHSTASVTGETHTTELLLLPLNLI